MANPIPSTTQRLVDPETGIVTVPWLQYLSGLSTPGTADFTWADVASGVGFQNSWVNFGGAFALAAYGMDANGVVHLRGVVKSGTVGTTIFTLPAAFRPVLAENFPCDANGTYGQINVSSTGNVRFFVGTNTAVSISGVTFTTN